MKNFYKYNSCEIIDLKLVNLDSFFFDDSDGRKLKIIYFTKSNKIDKFENTNYYTGIILYLNSLYVFLYKVENVQKLFNEIINSDGSIFCEIRKNNQSQILKKKCTDFYSDFDLKRIIDSNNEKKCFFIGNITFLCED